MTDNNNVNDSDNNQTAEDTREPIGTFDCYVSERIQELAQASPRQGQLTVSDAKLKEFLGFAGLEEQTVLSRRKGLGLLLEVRSPRGATIPLVMADTHAIWYGHQRSKSAQTLVSYLVTKGGGELPLLAVTPVNLTSGKGRRKQLKAEEMEDCPV